MIGNPTLTLQSGGADTLCVHSSPGDSNELTRLGTPAKTFHSGNLHDLLRGPYVTALQDPAKLKKNFFFKGKEEKK